MSSSLWQLNLFTNTFLMDAYVEALEQQALSLSWTITDEEKGQIHILAIFQNHIQAEVAKAGIILLKQSLQDDQTLLQIQKTPAVNWVEEYTRSVPALTIDRFYVYGSHLKGKPFPAASIPLWIDAGTAFGSGEHSTTEGCLRALGHLYKFFSPQAVLDMGCGTGILALAAAKLWSCRVVAGDIDSEAVRVTQQNAVRNQAKIKAFQCQGFASHSIQRRAPYDLIIANILAKPLCLMASSLVNHLSWSGKIILSGLLERQVNQVLAAYRQVGVKKLFSFCSRGWVTLGLEQREL